METLIAVLRAFFRDVAPLAPGDTLVIAFSGGPDSTALLAGAQQLSQAQGFRLLAAHLDHGMDPDSSHRARQAADIARQLHVPFLQDHRPVRPPRGESPEAAARRVRYTFLEEVRLRQGARWVATGHHRDDQAETLLLRWLQGTGLAGLAGIQPRRDRVVRPLLAVGREALARSLDDSGLGPVLDPSNMDPLQPRSRIRHHLLPHLEREMPGLSLRLCQLAASALRGRSAVAKKLRRHLQPRKVFQGIGIPRERLRDLPETLLEPALALLHFEAGAPYPAGEASRGELLRQLRAARGRGTRGQDLGIGCDCGGGWRWEKEGDLLVLRQPQAPPAVFTYTFEIPGSWEIPELSMRMTVRRGEAEESIASRQLTPTFPSTRPTLAAAIALPAGHGNTVTVRNRRPGDRIRPLGSSSSRRLKEVLIDRRVPRRQREYLPLLVIGDYIAWVPGVTIDDRFQGKSPDNLWIAKIEAI